MTQVFNSTAETNQAMQAQQILSQPCISRLPSLSILRVKGSNSAKLLHGQVTQNIEKMQQGELKQAAACSPKGRIYATFYVVHQGEDFDLILPTSTLDTTLQTLNKFAPLYRCQLEDAQTQYSLLGYNRAEALTDLPDTVKQVVLPDQSRSLLICPSEQLSALLAQLSGQLSIVDEPAWQLLNIRAGQVLIEQSQSDQFIPQMLNYQAVGAISFKKGCYTGQETIARAQYRGGVRKRLQPLLQDSAEAITVGTLIYVAGHDEAVGEVLLAASNEQGQQECLAVLKDSALEQSLHVGTQQGVQLKLLPLPYGLEKIDI
ncbi:hypothetical protein SAMN02745127_01557 [Oceanospirillum multiglobuliferum]|uniref:Uncharacterized protein n=1 Tax=Oceanospirillum multiglobuliferum TaxID=64969 RepID=A0A1T4PP67_9GAMM|nr:folate-binding protein YgfZ [Oceanospirillum multiglobuliferum]OPX55385.1 hypothetical protein BTE48_09470 [Oceanospirillum multiglobuliferum]SJZ93405.1 hypothetical protein SAMN02745127_01557 [Oceanospirillum multiglobuliferum]